MLTILRSAAAPPRHLLYALGVLGLLATIACGRAPSSASPDRGDADRLLLTGSSTVAPLMLAIGQRYEADHAGTRIDVETGGSSRGLADVRRSLSDLGMVSRSPRDGEDDLAWHPIARDGVGLIVHADNSIAQLDRAQVRAIYTGAVRDWAEVGGLPGPITVVHKADGRSTQEVFLDWLDLPADAVRADVVIGDNVQGIKTVIGNPGAIGYVSIGAAVIEQRGGAALRLPAIDGVAAQLDTVADGRFPIARTLHLVTAAPPADDTLGARVIRYAQSPAVHDLVREMALVPHAPR